MSEDIKKGLLGIVVDETTISQVMPDINSLTYRGYAVQDLCEKCTFEEVAYLILNKELPNKSQLKKFKKNLEEKYYVCNDECKDEHPPDRRGVPYVCIKLGRLKDSKKI